MANNDGYTVYKFYNGTDVLKCIESTELDLAILDIMLPYMDGFQICQKIREKFYFSIIMLTVEALDGDKIMVLSVADDYITKPFNPREVVARAMAQLRKYIYLVPKQRKNGVFLNGVCRYFTKKIEYQEFQKLVICD